MTFLIISNIILVLLVVYLLIFIRFMDTRLNKRITNILENQKIEADNQKQLHSEAKKTRQDIHKIVQDMTKLKTTKQIVR